MSWGLMPDQGPAGCPTIDDVHFLWPPFLVSTIAQRLRTQLEQRASDWFANLAYLD